MEKIMLKSVLIVFLVFFCNSAAVSQINTSLVTPEANSETKALYQFLLDHYQKRIITGVMTLNSMDEPNWLMQNTGKKPALIGIDFMHSNRDYSWYNELESVEDAIAWYGMNGIPALMWHWRDPSRVTESFYTSGTTFDVSKISDPNSEEYAAMVSDIDAVAEKLLLMQEAGVPVLWRPLHEAAGRWFWWGAKGPAPCKALYLLMYDRMVNHHGLKNLIWIWTREPGDDAWYPGDEYVDIVGRDLYMDGNHDSHLSEFNTISANYDDKKIIALSECGSFPAVQNLLDDRSGWSWYMPWYGDYTRDESKNPLSLWQDMFDHEYAITLDEMPDLSTYTETEIDEIELPLSTNALVLGENIEIFPTLVENNITIRSQEILDIVTIYSTNGNLVKSYENVERNAVLPLSELNPGLYHIIINHNENFRIVKN